MKPAKVLVLLATTLVLALSAKARVQNQITRPFLSIGHITVTVDLLDNSFTSSDWGEATSIGRYLAEGTGVIPDLTAQPLVLVGVGVLTAADGDQLFWTTGSSASFLVVSGGTGRFENAKGQANLVASSEPVVAVDTSTMTMTISIDYRFAGSLTY